MTNKQEDRAAELDSSAKLRITVELKNEARVSPSKQTISPITEASQQYLEQVRDGTSAPGNMLEQSNV